MSIECIKFGEVEVFGVFFFGVYRVFVYLDVMLMIFELFFWCVNLSFFLINVGGGFSIFMLVDIIIFMWKVFFFFFRVLVFKLLLELNCFKMLRVIIVGLLRSGKVKIVCMLFVVICGKRLKNNFFGYEVEND